MKKNNKCHSMMKEFRNNIRLIERIPLAVQSFVSTMQERNVRPEVISGQAAATPQEIKRIVRASKQTAQQYNLK